MVVLRDACQGRGGLSEFATCKVGAMVNLWRYR
jgi:hypothetical protein